MILPVLVLFAQDLSQQGAAAMRAGKFAEAERIYRQLIAGSPSVSEWKMNLGLALHSAGKYRQALGAFGEYIKSAPQPGPVHLLIGVDRLKLGEPCKAIDPLEKARQWQASRQVLVELADAYSGCKRYADAAALFDKLGEKRSAARAYWQARQYEPAKKLFEAIAASNKDDPEFIYEFGDTLYRTDGAEAALPLLERAVVIIAARGTLGRALMDLGRAKEAIPHLEVAAPADDTLLLPLSRAYKATGRAADAARVEAEYRKRVGGQN